MRFDSPLPCGCAPCGCICAEHSPFRIEEPCARHGLPVVARWVAGEVAALAALALLVACAAVWTEVLSRGVH